MSSSESRQQLFASGHRDFKSGRILPDEVLGLIFTFLPIADLSSCATVCHSWSKLTWYWQRNLALKGVRDSVDDSVIIRLQTKCKQLSVLDLEQCFMVSNASVPYLCSIPSLTNLNLNHCNRISDEGLELISSMNQLRHFRIGLNTKITSAGLQYITRLPLETLGLCGCRSLDSGSLLVLPPLSATLKTLDLAEGAAMKPSMDVLIEMTNLTSLSLFRCGLSDVQLGYLATLTAMQELDLGENPGISIVGIEAIGSLISLKNLSLRNGHKITDGALLYIGHMTQLRFLDLSRCSSIQDSGIIYLQHLKKLKVLDLSECQVGDEAAESLSNLTSLEKLTLRNCQISDDGVRELIWLQNISYLDIGNCYSVTNMGVALLGKLPRLHTLVLAGLNHINEGGLKHLTSCSALRNLNLSWCSSVVDSTVQVLLIAPLHTLELSSCKGITDAASSLLVHANHIQTLNLENCTNCTNRKWIAEIRAKSRLVTIV